MNSVQSKNRISNTNFAILGGAAATLSHALFLPPEAKASVKNTMFGKDHFMKVTKKYTEANIKSIGRKIDIESAMLNAEKMYPKLKEMASVVTKSLAQTFLITTSLLFLSKTVASKIQQHKADKSQ